MLFLSFTFVVEIYSLTYLYYNRKIAFILRRKQQGNKIITIKIKRLFVGATCLINGYPYKIMFNYFLPNEDKFELNACVYYIYQHYTFIEHLYKL